MSKKGGSIVRRDLLRALRCDEATLRRLIKSLLIAEEIESPEIVDGKVTYTYNPLMYSREASYNVWPYDDPFYLIMNVAIGGVLGGGTNVDQAAVCSKLGEMKIDYVRVYQ
ncbi:MAG: hypothetical protein IKN54_01555, partial [Lachnospiraceae bacterium]|nr:hypothetical protein [Lachnospiraceae bacterium]